MIFRVVELLNLRDFKYDHESLYLLDDGYLQEMLEKIKDQPPGVRHYKNEVAVNLEEIASDNQLGYKYDHESLHLLDNGYLQEMRRNIYLILDKDQPPGGRRYEDEVAVKLEEIAPDNQLGYLIPIIDQAYNRALISKESYDHLKTIISCKTILKFPNIDTRTREALAALNKLINDDQESSYNLTEAEYNYICDDIDHIKYPSSLYVLPESYRSTLKEKIESLLTSQNEEQEKAEAKKHLSPSDETSVIADQANASASASQNEEQKAAKKQKEEQEKVLSETRAIIPQPPAESLPQQDYAHSNGGHKFNVYRLILSAAIVAIGIACFVYLQVLAGWLAAGASAVKLHLSASTLDYAARSCAILICAIGAILGGKAILCADRHYKI